MEILKIDVSKKQEGFDDIYNILDNNGKYVVCPGSFIFISTNENSKEELNKIKDITIFEIEDIDNDIESGIIKSWLREEIVKYEIAKAKEEVDNRTKAIYDILSETEKIMKEKEELDKKNEQKT
ncbi:MAG: hypothetical protein IKI95_08530 [Clostridia bacterium]|nr:hypothetical protein [Clostridia bacterium]